MNAHVPMPETIIRDDYGRAHADGELGAGLSMIDHAIRALAMGTWHLDRAVSKGAGAAPDLDQLARLASELADIALKVETATSRLTAQVGR